MADKMPLPLTQTQNLVLDLYSEGVDLYRLGFKDTTATICDL